MKVLVWFVAIGLLGWPATIIFVLCLGGFSQPSVPPTTLGFSALLGYASVGFLAWWLLFRRPAKIAEAEVARAGLEAARRRERDAIAAKEAARVKAERLDEERASRARQFAANRERSAQEIAGNASRAADEYALLPSLIEQELASENEARRLFAEGVYSPFWAAIEGAYVSLGQCVSAIAAIQQAAERHTALIANHRSVYGESDVLATFPISIRAAAATTVTREASDRLGKLVYEAHKSADYSQIWEQRRTTSVMAYGFANLEQAVSGMSSRLDRSISSLNSGIAALGSGIAALGRSNVEASAAVVGAIASVNDDVALMGRPMIGAAASSVDRVRAAAQQLEAHAS